MSRVGLAAALAATLLACGGGSETGARPPEIPPLDLAGMETPVAAAIDSALRAASEDPGSPSRWGALGMVYHAHALYPQALAAYGHAETLDPEDYRWPYLSALVLSRDRVAEARAAFRRAARRSPGRASFWIAFADLLLRSGETAAAAEQLGRALEIDPRSSHALYGLAGVALAEGDLDRARDLLLEAVEIDPGQGEAHSRLAQVLERLGDEQGARRHEMLARAHPGVTRPADPVVEEMEAKGMSSRAHTARGLALTEAGRFAEAEREFRRVLAIRPGNAADYANLGGALARQGRLPEAVEVYHEGLRRHPDDPAILNNLALAEADRGSLAAAAEHLEKVLAASPRSARAKLNLGLVRARAGDHQRAVELYREALEIEPSLADAWQNLGSSLAGLGRTEEAIDCWERVLELDPDDLAALYNLGIAQAEAGDHRGAIERLRRAARTAPNSSRIALALAWELATAPQAALRDGAEAVALAQRVRQAYPSEPRPADVLAAALAETGDYEGARREAETALALARRGGSPAGVREIAARLAGYRVGRPFRQPDRP